MSAAVLEIQDLVIRRGDKVVVDRVSMRLPAGQIAALLGPNGAGKSSLVLALAGVLPVHSGSITLQGQRIDGLAPDALRRRGLAAVPEGHQVLSALSVEDNLRAAGAMLSLPDTEIALQRCYDVFPELKAVRLQLAGTLSGGQQQMVAIGHALMTNPRFVLIDEMSLGLAPLIVKRLMGVVGTLAAQGVGVLLIEQFAHLALQVANQAYVLSRGQLRYDGPPQTLVSDPSLLHAAYLGAGA